MSVHRLLGWLFLTVVGALAGCRDTPSLRAGQEGCVLSQCHGRVEHIHYGGPRLACIDCHGGNPDAVTKEGGHPTVSISFNAATPGTQEPGGRVLAGASLHELDELSPEVLMFLNPADYRIVTRTCGNPARGNCHNRIAEKSILSTHATLAGQLAGGLYFSGLTDKAARWSVRAVIDPFPVAQLGYVASLQLFPGSVAPMPEGGAVERGHFASFGQLCIDCHLSRDGAATPGKYTSSGCNACHLLTNDDARPQTTDPTQDAEELGHGARHRLTNLIPDQQCNRCHHAHLHRGLLSQGVRERSEPEGDQAIGGVNRGIEDPPNAVFWPEENYVRYQGAYYLYGKPFPFFIEDEDGTNNIDETPPDIHTEKGMACIDCHTMAELHGGEHMAVRREVETRVRCESCHGTPEVAMRPADSPFEVALSRVGGNADNIAAIRRDNMGNLVQVGKLDQVDHPVTQIAERADAQDPRFNPRVLMGCGLHSGSAAFRTQLFDQFAATDPLLVDDVFPGMPESSTLPGDFSSRAGRVECFACHNTWTLNCYGCHVQRDDRVTAFNAVTGEQVDGKVSTFAMSVLSDALSLGYNSRERISPMVGTSIFFTHIDAAGNKIVDAAPLRTADGFEGGGNQHNPVHHHTIRRQPRDCIGCHPRADGIPDDENALKRAIGFGTGEFLFTDGTGTQHVLDQTVALDFDGDGIFDDPATTPLGPVVMETLPIAASTHMSIHDGAVFVPGPLDRETINRLLGNRVVPQRPE